MGNREGEQIGHYELVEKLGAGAAGDVYKARHVHGGWHAAVKLLRRELMVQPGLLRRFFGEARAASSVRHPAIVQVFDVGFGPSGQPYLAMEYIEGETLAAARGRKGTFPLEEALTISAQIADVLSAVHSEGIVHRDVKPANIILGADRYSLIGRRAMLLDFGIAKLADNLNSMGVRTVQGEAFGTPQYMSPEQCFGSPDIDSRSDLYALGVIMFELICGERPFDNASALKIMYMQATADPVWPMTPAFRIPAQLRTLIEDLLAKRREDRPESALQVLDALQDFMNSTDDVGPRTSELLARPRSEVQRILASAPALRGESSRPRLKTSSRPESEAKTDQVDLRDPVFGSSEPPNTTPTNETSGREIRGDTAADTLEGETGLNLDAP